MIEEVVIGYLGSALDIPVFAERPEKPPAEYLIMERTGGGKTNHISRATMAVQSYADSMLRAAQINRSVEKAMEDLPETVNISKCELNSSYNYTDTESRKYRYQAVFDIIYMEGE